VITDVSGRMEQYALEMTQAAAAKTLGMSTVRLNELVRGKRGVTADTALRLAQLFKAVCPADPGRNVATE
jgi:addiction module HigA family antidote